MTLDAPLRVDSLLLCPHCRKWHPVIEGHTEGTPYTQAMLYFMCRGERYLRGADWASEATSHAAGIVMTTGDGVESSPEEGTAHDSRCGDPRFPDRHRALRSSSVAIADTQV